MIQYSTVICVLTTGSTGSVPVLMSNFAMAVDNLSICAPSIFSHVDDNDQNICHAIHLLKV